MKTTAAITLAVISALVLSAPASASSSQAQQVARLKRQIATLKRSRDKWESRALLARADLGTAKRDLASVKLALFGTTVQLSNMTGERDRIATQRDQLANGLPDAIKAVPAQDFVRLVLAPARATWRCSSIYTSGSWWSYTFDSSCP